MTAVLSIDPGTSVSGWALVDTDTTAVLLSGKDLNDFVLGCCDGTLRRTDAAAVLIESMNGAHAGMPFGVEKIEAVRWAGRFEQAAISARCPVVRISREEVKRILLGSPSVRNADTVVRQWLIDRYAALAGDPLGGKAAAVGLKATPGPLFGVVRDAWSAVALALAYVMGADDIVTERTEAARRKAERAPRKRDAA